MKFSSKTIRICGAIFVIGFMAAGSLFWHFYGRSLQYDVYSNDDYWYSEDFSDGFRVGLTLVVASVAASIPTWLVYAFRPGCCR